MVSLPPGQKRVLDFIAAFWAVEGRSPTFREIMAGLGFDSPNAVTNHLSLLEKKGVIERDHGARGIWPAGLRSLIRKAAVQLA